MWIAGDHTATFVAQSGPMPMWAWVLVVAIVAFGLFPRD